MPALTDDQLELLQRAGDGMPLWGGSTAIPRLERDVELLLALGLVEPAVPDAYRMTMLGLQALGFFHAVPSAAASGHDVGRLVVGTTVDDLPTRGP